MTAITSRFSFEMGHTLAHHPGKCRRLHGHTYHLEVVVQGEINAEGMVMDFGDLKRFVRAIVDRYDHMFMIWIGDPRKDKLMEADPHSLILTGFHPTAENIAITIRGEIASVLPENEIYVRLWETDDNRAEA